MSENEKSKRVKETKSTGKPENVIPKNEGTRWRIVNRVGRSERALAGPARPETMEAKYKELCSLGQIPGSIILLDENNRIEAQHSSFADTAVRRGRDEDGKAYEPTLADRGHKPLDLSIIADKIKELPETDPDKDPEPGEVADEPAAADRFALENMKKRLYEPPKVERLTPPPAAPKAASAPPPPKMPPPRSERMKGQPCSGGFVVRLISASNAFNHYRSQLYASKNRIERRDKRFVLEVLLRVAFGAPLCESTIHAAYSDAEDATRM